MRNGAISGIIAGILKDIPDAIIHNVLKFTNITFWDYASYIGLGNHPVGWGENLFAFAYEVVFSILVGIIFSLFIARSCIKKPGKYIVWGGYYGAIVWFLIRGAVLAFHITPLRDGHLATSLINSLDSVLYGAILGYILYRLNRREIRSVS